MTAEFVFTQAEIESALRRIIKERGFSVDEARFVVSERDPSAPGFSVTARVTARNKVPA